MRLNVLLACVLIVPAYLFLGAGGRGGFTWPQRIGSAVAFVLLCAAIMRAFRS